MVPDLRGVVVDAAAGFFDDFFERHGLKLGAFLQVVEVDHVGVVVLAVVKLQGFLGISGGQCVNGVGECGQGMFHGVPLGAWG